MHKRFLLIALVIGLTVAALVVRATKEGSSVVLLPSDLMAVERGKSLSRIRVGGQVAAEPISYRLEPEIELRFFLKNRDPSEKAQTVSLPVVYRGMKPDMFAPGRDVIIDGEYSGGVLTASKLLTQCPSKYEPPSPEEMARVKGGN